MIRERALKVVLVVVGLVWVAAGVMGLTQAGVPAYAQMIASLYGTLGVFMLLASRHPSANRSLIAFAGWSSVVHGSTMAVQALRNVISHGALYTDVLPIIVAGVVLLALLAGEPKLAAT